MQLSPLRYPGGKSKASKILKDFIPDDVSSVVSPFFGGGSFENYLALKGVKVKGYDLCLPLVDFWNAYLNDKDRLFSRLRELSNSILLPKFWVEKDKSEEYKTVRQEQRELFFSWRDVANNSDDPFERGLHYFALNRGAFSGMTLIGGPMCTKYIDVKLGDKAINNLEKVKFEVQSVEHRSCFDVVQENPDSFLYLDPPYIMETPDKEAIYGNKGDMHRGFDHTLLRDLLASHRGRWVLSYLDVPETRNLYKNFNITNVTWRYTMKPGKSRPEGKELVITNF
jgi:DNA adenine methylase